MDAADLLNCPLTELELSAAFIAQCRSMGFQNLGEITKLTSAALIQKKEFSYQWLAELSAYLGKHQLLYLLQAIPGKSPGQSV